MIRNLIRPIMVAGSVAVLLASGACQPPAARPARTDSPAAPRVASRLPSDALAQLSSSLEELAGKVSPAVVQIEVTGFRPAEGENRKTGGQSLMVRERSIGAGVIVDPDGYIITNAHVVAGAQRIRVILPVNPSSLFDVSGGGKAHVLDAKIIGSQPSMDLTLLKVQASGLPALHFNLDRIPQPGELVFAIGSPEGLQNSVSMGVVSSAWRQPDPDNPMVFLQTDAPINPGNSGGPLVDVTGAVVGINTFILSSTGGSQGLGFAIPAGVVDFVYRDLRKFGHVHHIEIGAMAQTITPAMAEGLGLAQNWGVVIADVVPGGPASIAGMEIGDIVVEIDAHSVLGLPGFAAALYQHRPDRELGMVVLRGTQKLPFSVAPIPAADRMDQLADADDPRKSQIATLGIIAIDFDDDLRSMLPEVRLSTGVIVVGREQGINIVETDLQPGDIIHFLNRTPIASVEQLRSALSQLKTGQAGVLQIERKGQLQYLAFEMD